MNKKVKIDITTTTETKRFECDVIVFNGNYLNCYIKEKCVVTFNVSEILTFGVWGV